MNERSRTAGSVVVPLVEPTASLLDRAWDVVKAYERGEKAVAFWLSHSNRLTREERSAIANSETSTIVRLFKPTWEEGDQIHVRTNLEILITKVVWKRDFWRTRYVVRDFRPNFMRRVPPTSEPRDMDIYGEPIPPSQAAIDEARVDGSFSRSYGLSVPDSAEEVGVEHLRVFAERAAVNHSIVHAERLARQDIKTVSQKLRRVQGEAKRKGVDISPDVQNLKRQVEDLERQVSDAA